MLISNGCNVINRSTWEGIVTSFTAFVAVYRKLNKTFNKITNI